MKPYRTRSIVAAAGTAASLVVGAQAASAATWTPESNPGVVAWEHGASNLGECSAFLATALPTNPRPDINEAIRLFGSQLPDGPYRNLGALYSARARRPHDSNLAPLQECLPRQLPG